jgi:hypothetical protein
VETFYKRHFEYQAIESIKLIPNILLVCERKRCVCVLTETCLRAQQHTWVDLPCVCCGGWCKQ